MKLVLNIAKLCNTNKSNDFMNFILGLNYNKDELKFVDTYRKEEIFINKLEELLKSINIKGNITI